MMSLLRWFFQEAYALMCILMMCPNSQRVARIGSGGMHSQYKRTLASLLVFRSTGFYALIVRVSKMGR